MSKVTKLTISFAVTDQYHDWPILHSNDFNMETNLSLCHQPKVVN